jgi:hypothetical protein
LNFVLFSFTLSFETGWTPWTPQKIAKSSDYGTSFGFSNAKAVRSRPFAGRLKRRWPSENVMQLEHVRGEIERMRLQVHRQRGDIKELQQVGISTASAEALLERMLDRIDKLCAERDRLKKELGQVKGKVLGGRSW